MLLCFFLLAAAPHESARQAAVARQDLAAAQAQADRLADQRAQAAAALRDVESAVLAASDKLAAATAAQTQAETALAQREAAFSSLLPLMLRLSRYPAETVLAVPEPPQQAMEGLLITRGLAVELNREAAALRIERAQAAELRLATVRQQQELAMQRLRQAERAASLDALVEAARGQVSAAEAEGRDAAAAVAAEAAQAATLPAAVSAMDTARAKAAGIAARQAALADQRRQKNTAQAARAREAALTRPLGAPLAQSVGRLVVPVAGRLVTAFGAQGAGGPATGITYATAPGAFVSSPCGGRVAFAAPFRSYGRLVILECGGGYDVVLAGLGRIDAAPGHAMRAGEPVGRMPDDGVVKGAVRPPLYVELREKGQPVNPVPFLNGKG